MSDMNMIRINIDLAVDFFQYCYNESVKELQRSLVDVEKFKELSWWERLATPSHEKYRLEWVAERNTQNEKQAYVNLRVLHHIRDSGGTYFQLDRPYIHDYFEWLDDRNTENMKKQIITEGGLYERTPDCL